MFKNSQTVRFPRASRLHPSGVTYEPAVISDARHLLVLRLNGIPRQAADSKVFKFQQVVTTSP